MCIYYWVEEILDISHKHLKQVNVPKCTSSEDCIQKFEGFKVLLVTDPKPTRERDIEVVEILKSNMHMSCKILAHCSRMGCWFYNNDAWLLIKTR